MSAIEEVRHTIKFDTHLSLRAKQNVLSVLVAMELLEKCAAKDELKSIGVCKSGDFWEAFIGGHYSEAVSADTLPQAIRLLANKIGL